MGQFFEKFWSSCIIFLLGAFIFFRCGDSASSEGGESPAIVTKPVPTPVLNFYFENSGSMYGYLTGSRDFQDPLSHLITHQVGKWKNHYYVMTGDSSLEEKLSGDKYVEFLEKNNLKELGATGSSPLRESFKKIINDCDTNEISIFITDGIFTGNSSGGAGSFFLRESLEKKISLFPFSSIIIKALVSFNGKYYCQDSNVYASNYNGTRPLYFFIFGNSNLIRKFSVDLFQDFPNMEDVNFFVFRESIGDSGTCSILPYHNKGLFKLVMKEDICEISEIKDAKRLPGQKKFGIYLGINLEDIKGFPVPENYLLNHENFRVENELFIINEVGLFKDFPGKVSPKCQNSYTHYLLLESDKNFFGDVVVNLIGQYPSWIKNTNTSTDCPIEDYQKKTYNFLQLIRGFKLAYGVEQEIPLKSFFFKIRG
jgi:hypothetical protein